MKKQSDYSINQPLYDYVVAHLRLLRESVGMVDFDELDRRARALLDFYEQQSGSPVDQVPLKISAYLEEKHADLKLARLFGRLLKDIYQENRGTLPPKSRNGYAYVEADRVLFNRAFEELRTYLGGGE